MRTLRVFTADGQLILTMTKPAFLVCAYLAKHLDRWVEEGLRVELTKS